MSISTTCEAGWWNCLVDLGDSAAWRKGRTVCGDPAVCEVRAMCLHEHDRRWQCCASCAEALTRRLATSPPQCPVCVHIDGRAHAGCPVMVTIGAQRLAVS